MKKLIIAGSLAAAAILSSFGAANAQSVAITNGDGPGYYHRHHHDDRGWHRGWDRARYEEPRCMTKMEKTIRHGHSIVKETRVCR